MINFNLSDELVRKLVIFKEVVFQSYSQLWMIKVWKLETLVREITAAGFMALSPEAIKLWVPWFGASDYLSPVSL